MLGIYRLDLDPHPPVHFAGLEGPGKMHWGVGVQVEPTNSKETKGNAIKTGGVGGSGHPSLREWGSGLRARGPGPSGLGPGLPAPGPVLRAPGPGPSMEYPRRGW